MCRNSALWRPERLHQVANTVLASRRVEQQSQCANARGVAEHTKETGRERLKLDLVSRHLNALENGHKPTCRIARLRVVLSHVSTALVHVQHSCVDHFRITGYIIVRMPGVKRILEMHETHMP